MLNFLKNLITKFHPNFFFKPLISRFSDDDDVKKVAHKQKMSRLNSAEILRVHTKKDNDETLKRIFCVITAKASLIKRSQETFIVKLT